VGHICGDMLKKTSLLAIAFAIGLTSAAQLEPVYKRFPSVPPFTLLLPDSTTMFTKDKLPAKKPALFILFSPDCDHCNEQVEKIIKHIDRFKNIEIVMATVLPHHKLREFTKRHRLSRFKNIHAGRDIYFMLPEFFAARSLPFLAFYDKAGKLIGAVNGGLSIEEILGKYVN
jgi:thioredoxin-related protein